jgi:hypothetical protein
VNTWAHFTWRHGNGYGHGQANHLLLNNGAACDPSFCPHTAAMAAQIAAHVAKAVAAEREAGRKLAAELERVCYANGVIERHGQRVEGGCGVNGDHDRCDCYFGRARAALAEYRKQGAS